MYHKFFGAYNLLPVVLLTPERKQTFQSSLKMDVSNSP